MAQIHDKIYSLYIQHFPGGIKKYENSGSNAGIPAKCKKRSLFICKVLELITVVCKCVCLEVLNEV
jgi:hypothetical protein